MILSPLNRNNEVCLAYDDEISTKRRDYIRNHINQDVFQSNDVFVKNPRLEEYQLDKLIKSLSLKKRFQKNEKSRIDPKIMEEIPLYNVHPLHGTSNYIGSTMDFTDEICQKLKQAGVEEVITFLNEDFDEDVCKRNELKYFSFPIKSDFWNSAQFQTRKGVIENAAMDYNIYFDSPYIKNYKEYYINRRMRAWEKESRIFIDKFTDFINEMKKDNLYIGCACGIDRTKIALILNSLFNPKASNIKPLVNTIFNNKEALKNLYYNLTPKDKAKMGWDKEFDENFLKRLNAIAKTNEPID